MTSTQFLKGEFGGLEDGQKVRIGGRSAGSLANEEEKLDRQDSSIGWLLVIMTQRRAAMRWLARDSSILHGARMGLSPFLSVASL